MSEFRPKEMILDHDQDILYPVQCGQNNVYMYYNENISMVRGHSKRKQTWQPGKYMYIVNMP